MSLERYLLDIPFDRNAGPVNPGHLGSSLDVTNCQRAVQEFYFRIYNIRLDEQQILSTSILNNGNYVISADDNPKVFFSKLSVGDLVYAERLRDKNARFIYRDRISFFDLQAWAKSLHLAVYLGKLEDHHELKEHFPQLRYWDEDKGIIYHANGVSRVSCLWTPEKFKWYYLPISAKRVIKF